MILYPAIDLKDGQAVRLVLGDMDQATVFSDDPAAQARSFVEAGCEWLHLVDLNGAFAGAPVNAAPVEAILKSSDVPAQLGGGIRDMATIETWLEPGNGWARDRSGPLGRGRGRCRDHLYRHPAGRCDGRAQHRSDRGSGARRGDPGDRFGRRVVTG